MTSRSMIFVVAAIAAASCSNSNHADAGRDAWVYQRPAVPDGAILLETPEYTVRAGDEILYCTYTATTLTEPFDTRELHSYQGPGGHHAILFYTSTYETPGAPHPCTDEEMTSLRLVGGGAESNEQGLRLPEGLAIKIPAGSQLVIQSHYLNVSTEDIRVRDALVAQRADPASIQHYADGFAISDGDMLIPPHASYGQTLECTIDADMNVVNMIGHTHQWATHLAVQRIAAGSQTVETIYDEVAGMRLQFNPPQRTFPLDAPLALHAGDRMRLVCEWNNTTDTPLGFPQEMCALFSYYYPGRGFISCGSVIETRGGGVDSGVMSTNGNAGCSTAWTPDQPCVRDCNTGNELGVGRHCTAGGLQCNGNHGAIICTADIDPSAPGFCTKPCSTNATCGSGAVCTGDSRGMGCTPAECVAPDDAGTDAATSTDAAPMDAASSMDATVGD